MWDKKTVTLIFPTYNEKESIKEAILDYQQYGIIDEVIVVNNNAAPGTSDEVSKTNAREVFEKTQGYGAAIRRGLDEAKGDYIIISEPDGTFMGKDIIKLLSYADDFDIVYGSRTVKELIWQGANMGIFLKWGNYAVAKLMEVLFNTTSLTDVGCTARCLNRNALKHLKPYFTVNGNFFGPEMMVLSILMKMKIVQLPVNYTRRVGESSVTGDHVKAFFLGLKMIQLILSYRFKGWFKRDDYPIFSK
jgi:glycosyltransferase involved in cell wall biosynthesis